MPISWDGDGSPSDQFLIERNLRSLLADLQRTAPNRVMPTIGLAREWHRRIFHGVAVPVPYYLGGIRDSNPSEPELVDHEVGIRGPVTISPAVPAANVPAELLGFRTWLVGETTRLDAQFPVGQAPPLSGVDEIMSCAAKAHGEWVRIHPFVNGNGRVARIWTNWCALRYGLPAFLRLRPRPAAATYASAAERSMQSDHRYMEIELVRQLTAYLAEHPLP